MEDEGDKGIFEKNVETCGNTQQLHLVSDLIVQWAINIFHTCNMWVYQPKVQIAI